MSDILLTRDADKTFCLIYKEYLSRRKNSLPKASASFFEKPTFKTLFPDINDSDFMSYIDELNRNNLITKYIDGGFVIRDEGIIYMENRFKNGFTEVIDFISKFIP